MRCKAGYRQHRNGMIFRIVEVDGGDDTSPVPTPDVVLTEGRLAP